MKTYKIYPLKVGEFYLDHSSVCYATNPGHKVLCPVLSFLIQGESDNILVDTGCCDEEKARNEHIPVKIQAGETLENALGQLGLRPEDIQKVVLTHLHWDHCYHNDLFPNAAFYVQKREVEFAENPLPCQCKAYEKLTADAEPLWWEPTRKKFYIIDGDMTLCKGVELLLLPGHTPGSMGVLVDTEAGKYLIAGDLIQSNLVFENLVCGLPKPSGVHTHLDQYYESLKRAMSLGAKILPAHEMAVLDHPVYPPVGDAE